MVKLSEVYMGMVVENRERLSMSGSQLVGMVIGISQNSYSEPTLVVQWQNDRTSPILPVNIDKVED